MSAKKPKVLVCPEDNLKFLLPVRERYEVEMATGAFKLTREEFLLRAKGAVGMVILPGAKKWTGRPWMPSVIKKNFDSHIFYK